MRLKCYSAASMAEAMAMVREELGDDAIIVSTQRASGGQGVRITAALEESTSDDEIQELLSGTKSSAVSEAVREALVYHGVPPRLTEKIVTAARKVDTENPTLACAGALDEVFAFAPLPERQAPRPFMMVGPPGSGKTITVAKLATRARLAGRSVAVITTDTIRAGAVDQLSAFTSILDVHLHKARGAQALRELVEEVGLYDLVFIDTPGLNPFQTQDMDFLRALADAADVEPVLIMAAGGDPVEAEEMAEAFAEAGATRLLATRLDVTRRLGAVLAAAETGQFMFCEVSITPHVATGLCPITPVSMARLLVPPDDADHAPDAPPHRRPDTETGREDAASPRAPAARTDDDADLSDLPPSEPEARPVFSFLDEFETDTAGPDAAPSGHANDPKIDEVRR